MDLLIVRKECENILKNAGVDNYKHNVKQIFLHVLNVSQEQLLVKTSLTNKEYKKIKKMVSKRAKGIPLQYLIKKVYFYNNTIFVNKNVLIPRNESEQLCEMVAKVSQNKRVLDLCCGSGCIGLGISKNSNSKVYLSDISYKALGIARRNAKYNKLKVRFIRSDLFNKINEKFDIIVSNPPYIKIKDYYNLSTEVGYEPKIALLAGVDGLVYYKSIIKSAPNFLNDGGEIFLEVGVGQANSVKKLLSKQFECIKIIKDYYNKNRFVYAKLKGKYVK